MAPDFIAQHPELPWADMRDMRNAIIHAYFNVDLTIVWRTVQDDLPKLKQQIHQLFTDRQSSSKAAKLAAIAETRAETERSTAHGRQRGKGRT